MPIPQRHKFDAARRARIRNEREHEQMVEAFLADLPDLNDEPRENTRAAAEQDEEVSHD